MSLFDQVSSMFKSESKGTGGDQLNLITGVLEMLNKGGQGGLAGLVQTFQAKGLGDIVSSWISTGPTRPSRPRRSRTCSATSDSGSSPGGLA
jgi:uncharacterized protein YidB (DUF937 family)